MTQKTFRKIQSFVRREGRMTPSQTRALDELWVKYGLNLDDGLLDIDAVFGEKKPLVLEIGFGMGEGLLQYAQQEPDKHFIGIEVHRPGVGALLNNADKAGVNNLRVFKDDAIDVLTRCIPDASLSRLQLFFPDPWHKKRHHKRRIVSPGFLALVAQKLQVGGVLHMATDWANYAEHMLEVANACPLFQNLSAAHDYIARPESRPLTKFEQRGLRLGHEVFDLQFAKK